MTNRSKNSFDRVEHSTFVQQKSAGLGSVLIHPPVIEEHAVNSASVWSHDGLNIVESPASILLGIQISQCVFE